jgi:hypothetical protein
MDTGFSSDSFFCRSINQSVRQQKILKCLSVKVFKFHNSSNALRGVGLCRWFWTLRYLSLIPDSNHMSLTKKAVVSGLLFETLFRDWLKFAWKHTSLFIYNDKIWMKKQITQYRPRNNFYILLKRSVSKLCLMLISCIIFIHAI